MKLAHTKVALRLAKNHTHRKRILRHGKFNLTFGKSFEMQPLTFCKTSVVRSDCVA